MNARQMNRMVQGRSLQWVEWTCPFCLAEMSDPPHIKETSCRAGHIVYLGKVEFDCTYRAAYKSAGERRRKEKEARNKRLLFQEILKGAFRPVTSAISRSHIKGDVKKT